MTQQPNKPADERGALEAAYRRGWQQGATEATRIVLQLVAMAMIVGRSINFSRSTRIIASARGAMMAIWSGKSHFPRSMSSSLSRSLPHIMGMTGFSMKPENVTAVGRSSFGPPSIWKEKNMKRDPDSLRHLVSVISGGNYSLSLATVDPTQILYNGKIRTRAPFIIRDMQDGATCCC